jgi:hypothetical protein
MMRLRRLLVFIVTGATLSLTTAVAAVEKSPAKGVIEGMVTAWKKPVARVKVIAFNLDTGDAYEALSDARGAYAFRELTKGDYELSVYHQGYEVYTSPELKVEIQKTARHDISLTPAPAANRR